MDNFYQFYYIFVVRNCLQDLSFSYKALACACHEFSDSQTTVHLKQVPVPGLLIYWLFLDLLLLSFYCLIFFVTFLDEFLGSEVSWLSIKWRLFHLDLVDSAILARAKLLDDCVLLFKCLNVFFFRNWQIAQKQWRFCHFYWLLAC